MSQQIDLASAVGWQDEDQPVSPQAILCRLYLPGYICQVSWNQRDLLIYGVGIGAKSNDFAIINGACKSSSNALSC